jgi:DNA helicase-2/ATP-dependent DNA helicase PcrA
MRRMPPVTDASSLGAPAGESRVLPGQAAFAGATLAPALARLVARLDPEQRAAALLPDGPAQIIAPAGSGKTTTLIARLGVLLARGVRGGRIGVVTFNRDAAGELKERVGRELVPHLPSAGDIEIRTLHALGRQVLRDADERLELLADRAPLLRRARREVAAERGGDRAPPDLGALDTLISAWKVERREPPAEMAPFVERYARLLDAAGRLDFDDLLVRAVMLLESDAAVRRRWQVRFSHLLVDEFQDVDALQLRLVQLLAEPERNLFVVGDDDQTIYAWRLADVRRMLDFGRDYPESRRVILATNYRCPAALVEAARRLVEHNRERFHKPIRACTTDTGGSREPVLRALAASRPGWAAALVAEATGSVVKGRVAILARTESELVPIRVALVCAGVPHASRIATPLDPTPSIELLDELRRLPPACEPFAALVQARAARGWRRQDELLSDDEQAALDALLSWAPAYPSAAEFIAAADRVREQLQRLDDPTAPIELLTVHAAKGREWPTVFLVGMERDRFPNRRALAGAIDRARALEEERRLAYVALTRARRSLVLVLDPSRPSRFLEEAGLGVRGG